MNQHQEQSNPPADLPIAVISLTFDYDQRSQQLGWGAKDSAGKDLYGRWGKSAGGLSLLTNQQVSFLVEGGTSNFIDGKPWTFSVKSLFVINAPLTTYKTADGHVSWFSSPFLPVGVNAHEAHHPGSPVREVGGFSQSAVATDDPCIYYRSSVTSSEPLQVIQSIPSAGASLDDDDPIGRWSMTFLLTVKIQHPTNSAVFYFRTFRLDPETEVGNGFSEG